MRHRWWHTAMAVAVAAVVTGAAPERAVALVPLPPPVALPAGISVALTGEGVATAVGGTAAAAGATAAAPVLVTVGAVLAVGAAVYVGWRFLDGHEKNADQVTAAQRYDGYVTITGPFNSGACCGTPLTYHVTYKTQVTGTPYRYYRLARFHLSSPVNGSQYAVAGPDESVPVATAGGQISKSLTSPFSNANSLDGWEEFRCTGAPTIALSWGGQVPSNCGIVLTYGSGRSATVPLAVVPGTTAPNPSRRLVSTSECSNAGGDLTTVTAPYQTFTENDATYPPILAPECPETFPHRTGWITTSQPLDGTGNVVGTTTEVLRYTQPVLDLYPECVHSTCLMTLKKVLPDGSLQLCTAAGECYGWQEDPAKNQTYRCFFGPYPVALSECTHVYVGEAPVGGEDEDTDNCVPSGWGLFNPLEWVYKPVKCVLIWAFKPPAGYLETKTAALRAAYDGSAVGVTTAAVGNTWAALAAAFDTSAGSCLGPPLGPIPQIQLNDPVYPLDTCPGAPLRPVAAVLRPIETVIIYVAALLLCAKLVLGAFGLPLPFGAVADSTGSSA